MLEEKEFRYTLSPVRLYGTYIIILNHILVGQWITNNINKELYYTLFRTKVHQLVDETTSDMTQILKKLQYLLLKLIQK